jgi:hypothetical protein
VKECGRQIVKRNAAAQSGSILARFTEVAGGRNAARPELARALHLAKVTGATPVIAKRDRLSRKCVGRRPAARRSAGWRR